MKRPIIYFFLCVYLFSFTEVRQILKFPNLIEHYITHKASDKNVTLFSFLKMHYLGKNVKDADYKQDMKLPFKSHETNSCCVNLLTIPERFGFSFKVPEIFIEKVSIFSYTVSYASNLLASIFRPPIFG